MQMNADGEKVRRCREERCWSQDHLAEAAGVSLRTVQRVERGDSVSKDTLMALAAAFDIDGAALAVDPAREAATAAAKRDEKKNAALRLSFWIHLTTYVGVIALLAAIDFVDRPDHVWITWPAIGWGVGVFAHGATAFLIGRSDADQPMHR